MMRHSPRIIPVLCILGSAGCAVVINPAGMSSGFMGCPPEEITITDGHTVGSAPFYWTATCRGRRFHCSVAAEFASCAPELAVVESSPHDPCELVRTRAQDCASAAGEQATVVIDAGGDVAAIEGVEGEARSCLAHALVSFRIPAPGEEMRCAVP